MQKGSIFEYTDFLRYFDERFAAFGKSRGMRTKLAENLKVRPSYVSKILSGEIKLSLEYLPPINRLLEHNVEEKKFLMKLVLYRQAGTKELEKYFKAEIDEILEARRVEATWIRERNEISEVDQAKFVSNWYYSVIHVLTNISAFQTKSTIAQRLNLSLGTVTEALEFLLKLGIIEARGDRFKMSQKRLHLKKGSVWSSQFHSQVRQLATRSLVEEMPEDLHYSFVMSISNADKERIRKKLQEAIAEVEPIISESRDEDACVLALDFFKV